MKKSRNCIKNIAIILTIPLLLSSFSNALPVADNKEDISIYEAESGVPISTEITAQRGEFEKHFLLADGSFIAVSYAEAIHYKNGDEWTEVDNRLSLDHNGRIKNNYNDFAVSFAYSAADDHLVLISKDGKDFSWSLAVKGKFISAEKQLPLNASKAEFINKSEEEIAFTGKSINEVEELTVRKASARIEYNDLFMEAPEISAKYTVFHNKIEEDIIINAQTQAREFIFTVCNGGLNALLCEDGSVEFRSAKGDVEYIISPPYMCDANDEILHDIQVTVDNNGSTTIITYIPNAQWLTSKERAYPILLDPSITTSEYNSNIVDTYVVQDDTTNHSAEQYLYYGVKNNKIHRIYIKINNLPNIDASMPITNAKMKMTFISGTTTGKPVRVYKVADEWLPSTITYDNQPQHDLSNLLDSCDFTEGYLTFNLTDNFSNLYSEYFACMNNGFMIRYYDESNVAADYNVFRSIEYTANPEQRPLFTISYGYALPSTLTDGGVYSFRNYESGSYMTVHDGLDINNTNVYQQSVASVNNLSSKHKFKLEYVSSSGGYRLKAMCSANQYKTLDIVRINGFVEEGGNVQIYNPNDDLAQHWFIVGTGDDTFRLIPRTNMSLALTVFPSSANGTAYGTTQNSTGNIFVSEYDNSNPYQLWQIIDSSAALVPFSPTNFPSGIYYINNSYYGKYFHKSGNILNPESGLLEDLEDSIKWEVYYQGNGKYTIQPHNDLTKYLCITSSNVLSLLSLPSSGLTDNYLWIFETPHNSGGKHIRNAATNKYLYEPNDLNISVSNETGGNDSDHFKMCVWRMAETSFYGNTNDYPSRELPDNYSVNLLPLLLNEQSHPIVDSFPRTANDSLVIWKSPSDFEYIIESEDSTIQRTGDYNFKGINYGNTKVKAIHKPTGTEKEFYICVCKHSLIVHTYYDNGFITRNTYGETLNIATIEKRLKKVTDFASYVYAYNLGVKIIVESPELFTSSADACNGYSSIYQLNSPCSCSNHSVGTDNSNDTTHKNNRLIRNVFMSLYPASNQEKYFIWTGHYTWEWQGGTRKCIESGAFTNSVGGQYVMELNKTFASNPLNDNALYYTVIHEMGHLLGMYDSYCAGENCHNAHCAWHDGFGSYGQCCVMSNRSYIEINIFSDYFDNNYELFLCNQCRTDALAWIESNLN